jgi:hypothetical protein
MTDFTFTSTSECDVCGAYLSSSDEECDHDGYDVKTFTFRRLNEGRESMTGVESVATRKWHDLEEKVGDDWIAYQYIGTREQVESMLSGTMWDDVSDLPMISMSTDAPKDVGEESED